jgi:hypothetical protein
MKERKLSAMTILLLLLFIALAYAGISGRGVTDSRDTRFSLWR